MGVTDISRWYCIPPANYLEMMKDWPFHMIIGPHVLHNKKYRQFYMDNPQLHTMLDNGLWEGEVLTNSKLLKMANDLHVNEIIAPDDASTIKTIQKTKRFMKYLDKKGERYDFKIHGAIHGESWDEQLNCYMTFQELELDIVDLPKMLGSTTRLKWVNAITTDSSLPRAYTMSIHLLGFYKEELELLKHSAHIRSFDTSVPFKPKYGEKFNLELPYSWWNRMIIKQRLRYWRKTYKVK